MSDYRGRWQEARHAIPKLQQLPETCALFERLGFTEDCRNEVDRRLAAEALRARLRVFAIREKMEDPAMRAELKTTMAADEYSIYLSSLCDELLYDTQLDVRQQEFGSQWHLGYPPSPHDNMACERLRASRACGWADVSGSLDLSIGLRRADALDLADPWPDDTIAPKCPVSWSRLYGADAFRRDHFKDRRRCLAWWLGLVAGCNTSVDGSGTKPPKALELDLIQKQKIMALTKRFAPERLSAFDSTPSWYHMETHVICTNRGPSW